MQFSMPLLAVLILEGALRRALPVRVREERVNGLKLMRLCIVSHPTLPGRWLQLMENPHVIGRERKSRVSGLVSLMKFWKVGGGEIEREREREREREEVGAGTLPGRWQLLMVSPSAIGGEMNGERESVCVCLCVCERERERERTRKCLTTLAWIHVPRGHIHLL